MREESLQKKEITLYDCKRALSFEGARCFYLKIAVAFSPRNDSIKKCAGRTIHFTFNCNFRVCAKT